MESILGWDFITGEDLTDFERGLRVAGALIDLATFGNGAMLTKAAEKGVLDYFGVVFKTMAVDAAGSGVTYFTGKSLEDIGQDAEYLRNAWFSDADILKIQNGRVPYGWKVHHKLPLDDSGTNSFDI